MVAGASNPASVGISFGEGVRACESLDRPHARSRICIVETFERGSVMPALQVRDFPDELYGRLKACAEHEHRSIAQQTIVAVEEMLRARCAADGAGADAVASKSCRAFSYFDLSTEAQRAARIERRKGLFARIERINANRPAPPPAGEQMVQWIRDDRDFDHGRDAELFEPIRQSEGPR